MFTTVCCIVSLLLCSPEPSASLGLVTTLLTRSLSLVKPSYMTVDITTKITLNGLHLQSSDRIRLSTTSACTSFLSAAATLSASSHLTSDDTSYSADVLVPLSSGISVETTSYVCLQVDGTIDAATAYADTGAKIKVNPKSIISAINIINVEPSHWMVAPLSSLTITFDVQGYGLLNNVSATLSSAEVCGVTSHISSYSTLANVTDDATHGTLTFHLPSDKVQLVLKPSLNLARNLTNVQYKTNLIPTKNASGWYFCYDPTNNVQQVNTPVKHKLIPSYASPIVLSEDVALFTLSGIIIHASINFSILSSTSTFVAMSIMYNKILLKNDIINIYLPSFHGIPFNGIGHSIVDTKSTSFSDANTAWNSVSFYILFNFQYIVH